MEQATDADAAVASINERLGWLNRHALNADLDLLAVDYLPESESLDQVDFGALPEDAQSMVIANMKAYQRVRAIGAGGNTASRSSRPASAPRARSQHGLQPRSPNKRASRSRRPAAMRSRPNTWPTRPR